MPPLSQLAQMGPGNVFGGLGKGLGAAIGGGISKQIQRPLFNRLAEKYVAGKQAPVETALMSSMGLTEAPVQGTPEYNEYFQQLNAAMAPYQGRADVATQLWEQDPEMARKYLTAETAADKRKDAGKLTKAELVGSPAARAIMTRIDDLRKKMVAPGVTPEQFQAMQVEKQGLMDQFFGITGHNLSDQTFNQYRDLYLTPERKKKEDQDLAKTVSDENKATLKQAQAFADSQLTKAGGDKLIQQANALGPAVSRIQDAIKQPFEELAKNPSTLFSAVKSLAQIIEPGLQVTEGEAKAFLGETTVSKFLQSLRQGGQSLGAFISNWGKAGSLTDNASAAATYDSPELLWELLVASSNMAAATQTAYQGLMEAIPLRAMHASDANMKALFTNNKLVDPQQQAAIQNAVDTNISNRFPTITPMERIPYGTPMPTLGQPEETPTEEEDQTLVEPEAQGDESGGLDITEEVQEGLTDAEKQIVKNWLSGGG